MPGQAGASYGESGSGEPLTEVAHLPRCPGEAVHTHDTDISASVESERADDLSIAGSRHEGFVITPVRTLTGAAVCAWIERIPTVCVPAMAKS